MTAFPGDGVLLAAYRWLRLLERSTLTQAWAILRADTSYTHVSTTQYASALEWMQRWGILKVEGDTCVLKSEARGLSATQAGQLLFARSLETAAPAWLRDAESLIQDRQDLPQDAVDVAQVFQLDETSTLLTIRQVYGRVDLAERARIGAAGERALVDLLEQHWPGSTRHVALTDDGFGYDVDFNCEGRSWHLEVKSTERRGSLRIYVSRHELDVASLDPHWRLVVVGLDENGAPGSVATVSAEVLLQRAPRDQSFSARWQSVTFQLSGNDLTAGLNFVRGAHRGEPDSILSQGWVAGGPSFAWMPCQ